MTVESEDTASKLNKILQWLGLDTTGKDETKPAAEAEPETEQQAETDQEQAVEQDVDTQQDSTPEPQQEPEPEPEPESESQEEPEPVAGQDTQPEHDVDERDATIAQLKRDNAIKDARLSYPQLTAEDFELCQETDPDKISAWAQRFAKRVGVATQGQHKLVDQAKKANQRASKANDGESVEALYKKALEAK